MKLQLIKLKFAGLAYGMVYLDFMVGGNRWIVIKESKQSDKVVLILSGGMDSTTLLYQLIQEKKEIYTISYNYGQKHTKELDAAKKSTAMLNIPHKIVSLKGLIESNIFGDNTITSNNAIPEGHYTEESMKSTVVPNRNMVMISIAISYAISLGASEVYYGAHAGDHAIYPDCRPEFVEAMDHVSKLCDYQKMSVQAPFLHCNKAEIVAKGLKLGVNYASTWTCYKGQEKACGKCGSCVERLEAFQINKVIDPLDYEGDSA